MARHKYTRTLADIRHELTLEARYWSHQWHDRRKYQLRAFFLRERHPHDKCRDVITRLVGLFGQGGAK